jgi:biotin carboxylase
MLLEAAGPEAEALARAAAASGHRVHAVTTATSHAAYPPELHQLLDGSLLTDFAHPEQALADITRYAHEIGAAALLTSNEYLTPLCARACADLGLPGNDPDHAVAARDKAAMAQAFETADVTAPRTRSITTLDALDALHAARALRYPCVIKPTCGAGSNGVSVVTGPEHLHAAWHAARSVETMYGMACEDGVLAQDYVTGREFSVESLTQDGTTTHLCITRKHLTAGAHRVEVGHSLPARLSPAVEAALYEQTERAIAAVGIRNGASHTELVVTPDGRCTVLEIGARLGAGRIGVLIQHALGIDPWRALWDIALGHAPKAEVQSCHYATVRFVTSPAVGRLVSVNGLPDVGERTPDVHLRCAEGDLVGPASSNRSRLGHFIVTGHDPAAVDHTADQILRRITVTVDTGSPA